MPRAQLTDDQILDEGEKLFLERAKAYYRELRQVAQNAPIGKIINRADAFPSRLPAMVVERTLHRR